MFDALPRTGLPEPLVSWTEYQRMIGHMTSSGLLEDGSKIWWDLRPSSRFPTLEMRICDVCPDMEDALAVAALFQCILRMLYRLRLGNQRWREYPNMLIQENRWLAQRYGSRSRLVDFGKRALVPFARPHGRAAGAAGGGCGRARLHGGGGARAPDRGLRHLGGAPGGPPSRPLAARPTAARRCARVVRGLAAETVGGLG